jgi:Raf kinase inhibitor-like YbhB/YbcL family protein
MNKAALRGGWTDAGKKSLLRFSKYPEKSMLKIRTHTFGALAFGALAFGVLAFGALLPAGPALAQAPATPPPPFILSSTSFQDGGVIPDRYTQASTTAAISPALSWINAPAATVTYTLIMHDPDTAPRKSTTDILHWMAFNIPGSTTALPEGVATTPSLPDGTVQPNNFGGKPGFMGPGARGVYHHYTIELYALDTKLSLGADATREQVMAAMEGHVVGKAAIEGRFRR